MLLKQVKILEELIAKLGERVAVLERDCPQSCYARAERERIARQKPILEAEQLTKEKRRACVERECRRDPILSVTIANVTHALATARDSALCYEAELINETGVIRQQRYFRKSAWDKLCRQFPDDVVHSDLTVLRIRQLDIANPQDFEIADQLTGAA